MSDDLKQNLRGSCYLAFEDGTNDYETAPEAANRIEELEAANELLNEQLESIEEYGNEALNALPDCLMQLAPALVENDELKAKLAVAVEALEFYADADNYEDQHKQESCGCCSYLQDAEIKEDEGVKARATLAELKGEQP